MNSAQRILARADGLLHKTAASALYKYTDGEGGDFYLQEKKTGTLKSPFSGKSFTAKPEKSSMSDVGKGLKDEDKKANLFKYTDDDGHVFFLEEKKTGTLKSPFSGKSFKAVSDKETLADVSKGLKDKTAATTGESMEATQEFVEKGMGHPAMVLLAKDLTKVMAEWNDVQKELAAAQKGAKAINSSDGNFFKATISAIRHLARVSDTLAKRAELISKQMESRLL